MLNSDEAMTALEKKFSVFVSSTYDDLRDERIAVSQALLELGCFPAGMELFPASNDEQWSLIQKAIDEADYYVAIVAGRYGSTTPDGTSYTEREYNYALKIKLPILTFLHRSPGTISKDKCESSDEGQRKLDAFRTKVTSGRTVRQWTTAEELKGHVLSSLISAFKTHPRIGWIRADQTAQLDTLREINELRKENERLKQSEADSSASAPPEHEKYAGGSDRYLVLGYKQDTPDTKTSRWEASLSWDDIFRYVGPNFAEGMTRLEAIEAMEVIYSVSDRYRAVPAPFSKSVYANIGDQILYQFSALGLISRGTGGTWRLTSFGERKLVDLFAIKRATDRSELRESAK